MFYYKIKYYSLKNLIKNKKLLVSIIIPVFNEERTIRDI
jgi:hypothetical protein